MSDKPSHGARFTFDRLAVEGEAARYGVLVVGPEREERAEARLTPTSVELGPFRGSVDPWAERSARAFLDVIQRGYDHEAGWPRHVQRWRAPRSED
jgi:hypothetical protein